MEEKSEIICIQCPVGCPLQLTHEGHKIIKVEGYNCNRGEKYARQEFTDPRRSLSTTIRIEGGLWDRLPVKVSQPIPKEEIKEAARLIHQLQRRAPIKCGEILLENILGHEGIHVVASRSMACRA